MCDAPLGSAATVSTCLPEDYHDALSVQGSSWQGSPSFVSVPEVTQLEASPILWHSQEYSHFTSPIFSRSREYSRLASPPSFVQSVTPHQTRSEDLQLTSSPSAISRTMSAPSLAGTSQPPLP